MAVIKPYNGNEPYIFISYSHRDTDYVYPIIEELSKQGYRVWYDMGIDPGTEWDENIAMHINECGYFIAFMSQNYLNSSNCKDELNYARDLEKERLVVYLENVTLPAGMAMRINRLQSIFKYSYANDSDFYERLVTANNINICLSKASEPTPVVAESIEPTPVETKPVEPTPVEPKPVEPKPVEPMPVETKPVAPTPVEPKPVETKPTLSSGSVSSAPTAEPTYNSADKAKKISISKPIVCVLIAFGLIFISFALYIEPLIPSIIASALFVVAARHTKGFVGRVCLIFVFIAEAFLQLVLFIISSLLLKGVLLPIAISAITLALIIVMFVKNKE
ncbi:MAG: TIR domain-containing protein [Clostridia bacterium]|nr:TIR domain-containing protein [Clostridia bacterium]